MCCIYQLLYISLYYQKNKTNKKNKFMKKRTLYYVVTRDIESDGCFDYATDRKMVTVYEIIDNKPKSILDFTIGVSEETEKRILEELDNIDVYLQEL